MNFSKKWMFIFFSSLVIYATGQAQPLMTSRLSSDTPSVKTVTMAAGKQFKASAWKQLWWGKHWRPEWLVPVTFNVFDIDTTAGGLTPLKRGGGHQTKSLRLSSKDGREYILRTIDKDLDLLIKKVPQQDAVTFQMKVKFLAKQWMIVVCFGCPSPHFRQQDLQRRRNSRITIG